MDNNYLFGVKGLSFTPGEHGFPKIVAPGARPSIGTGAEVAGLGGKYTSYWWNATKESGYSIYDMAAGSIMYANPNNMKAGGLAGTGIGPKFYGMSDSELIDLGKNPNLKGSVVFSQIPKKIDDELVANVFSEPGFGGATSASGIQSATNVKPSAIMSTPSQITYSTKGAKYGSVPVSADVLRQEEFHDWMQDFAKNIKGMGVADENLPAGAKELLNAPRTSDYESAVKKYLMGHENPQFRKTSEELEGLKVLSRDYKLHGREDSVIAYRIGEGKAQYANKLNVEKLIESSKEAAKSKVLRPVSSMRGKIGSTKVARSELTKAIRPARSETDNLLKAAGAAAKAVVNRDSTAMRIAGAATTILRKRVI